MTGIDVSQSAPSQTELEAVNGGTELEAFNGETELEAFNGAPHNVSPNVMPRASTALLAHDFQLRRRPRQRLELTTTPLQNQEFEMDGSSEVPQVELQELTPREFRFPESHVIREANQPSSPSLHEETMPQYELTASTSPLMYELPERSGDLLRPFDMSEVVWSTGAEYQWRTNSQPEHVAPIPMDLTEQRQLSRIASHDSVDPGRELPTYPDIPEVHWNSDADYQDRANLEPGHTTPFLTNLAQQRPSSFATIHCNRILKCEGHCPCICHLKQRFRSPRVFDKLIGTLFIGYTGLPISVSKCDHHPCKNHVPRSVRASYIFPAWFLTKTLDFIMRYSHSMSGPCIGLSVRNRVNPAAGMNIITLAQNGDTSGIIKLLEQHKGSLTDISHIRGASAFHVSIDLRGITHILQDQRIITDT